MKILPSVAILIAIAGPCAVDAAGQVAELNLDATDGFNAVGLLLDAGHYNISLKAGDYTAWSAWSEASEDCSNDCAQGWLNFYAVFNHQTGQGVYVENGIGTPLAEYDFSARRAYSLPGAALAAGVLPYSFVLDSPATFEIAIPDCDGCFGDNRGGLSLLVNRILGTGPRNPFLPTLIDDDGSFVFNDAPSGCWFDPPLVGAYQFATTDGSLFTEMGMPPLDVVGDSDGMYLVTSILGSQSIAAGANLIFSSPVDFFTVSGISPLVDGADASAFPTYLVFDHPTASFAMTPLPEPGTLLLAAFACVGLLLRPRR
jgi:hypothetical protein